MHTLHSVHPHMRGEHPTCWRVAIPSFGSSPHAWGTRRGRGRPRGELRFIPTCVGNTSRIPSPSTAIPVHPHMRGEHGGVGDGRASSTRFIPTCVGNTVPHQSALTLEAVHPHMRGEHGEVVDPVTGEVGSS